MHIQTTTQIVIEVEDGIVLEQVQEVAVWENVLKQTSHNK
jgi:hypothetical protein